MKKLMINNFVKYFILILIIVLVLSAFPQLTNSVRFTAVSIIKNILPDDRVKPIIQNLNSENVDEVINSNSFEINVTNLSNFVGYNINLDGSINNQHKSAGLFGEIINDEISLELFTRDGSVIKNGVTKVYDLPNNYDPHNSAGGIRGVFFIENDPSSHLKQYHVYLYTKKIFESILKK